MAVFRINRTNDAVFKAVFAKYPKITLSLINAFLEFQGTEQLVDIEFIDREIDSDECEGKESRLDILNCRQRRSHQRGNGGGRRVHQRRSGKEVL